MSNTCRPSNPRGTDSTSQVAAGFVVFEFHERTRMSSHTMMSPWFPSVEPGEHPV